MASRRNKNRRNRPPNQRNNAKKEMFSHEYMHQTSSFLAWDRDEWNGKRIRTVRVSDVLEGRRSRSDRNPEFILKTNWQVVEICPLFKQYGCANFLLVHFPPYNRCPRETMISFLKAGIRVQGCEKRFGFFGHSASQLRNRTCVMYNEGLGSVEDIVWEFGDFDQIKTVAKKASRIGLLLSTATTHLELMEKDIEWIPDIERNGYCFTDGCGMISAHAAESIVADMEIPSFRYQHQKFKVPSVFQIRLMGCKGTLALDRSNNKKVKLRDSLRKFDWKKPSPYQLGIVSDGVSRPNTIGSLNKQYIMLLSSLGIPDAVFLQKQQTYFGEIQNLLNDENIAFKHLCANECFSEAEDLLKPQSSLEIRKQSGQSDPVIRKLKEIQARLIKPSNYSTPNPMQKEKKDKASSLKIPVQQSRNIFGICDQTAKLRSGQCFVQITVKGHAEILEPGTEVIVVKCPCYFPGDIRVLTCESIPELDHLTDCIVFPTEGERPHADEITGSDLDGDKFFVCWDPELIPLLENRKKASSFPSSKAPELDSITMNDMVEAFSQYDDTILGRLNNLYIRWAEIHGAECKECYKIAALTAKAVDAAKTGEIVRIPGHLLRVKRAEPCSSDGAVQDPADVVNSKKNINKKIWQKMEYVAQIYKKGPLLSDATIRSMTSELLQDILSDRESTMTYFQRFRILYKWVQVQETENLVELIQRIKFSDFTKQQLQLVPLDVFKLVPRIREEFLLGDISRSRILKPEVTREMFKDRLGSVWFQCYPSFQDNIEDEDRTLQEVVPWHLLKTMLQSEERKIILFEVDMDVEGRSVQVNPGNEKWIVAVEIPIPLTLCDIVYMPETEEKRFASVYIPNTPKRKMQLGKAYIAHFNGKRLDFYTGNRHGTFISLRESEPTGTTVVSIALDRMGIKRADQVKMRQQLVTRFEVFYERPATEFHMRRELFEQHMDDTSNDPQMESEGFDFSANADQFPSLQEVILAQTVPTQESIKRAEDSLFKKSQSPTEDISIADVQKYMDDFFQLSAYSAHVASVISYYLDYQQGLYLEKFSDYCKLILALLQNHCHFSCAEKLLKNLRNTHQVPIKDLVAFIKDVIITPGLHSESLTSFLRNIQIEMFPRPTSVEEKTYTYFCQWAVLIALELQHEIEEAGIIARGLFPRKVTIGTATLGDDDSVHLEITSGQQLMFSNEKQEYISLSPVVKEEDGINCYRPTYIAQVKDAQGPFLDISIAWKDLESSKLEGDWRVDAFPSLISYERMMSALCKAAECCDEHLVVMKILNWNSREDSGSYANSSQAGANDVSGLSLDENQKKAVLMAKMEPVSLIHGPPGTGKTRTAAEVVRQWLQDAVDPSCKVLVTAETNEGVDNLIDKMLDGKVLEAADIMRIGNLTSVRRQHHRLLPEKRYEERFKSSKGYDMKKMKKLVADAKVVCATCIGCDASLLQELDFTHVLIDEAGQAMEPACLVPISKGCKRLCLIGDEKQLPPLVKSSEATGLKRTLFQRLKDQQFPLVMLNVQYRMHPAIRQFPSDNFYQGQLQDGPDVDAQPELSSHIKWPTPSFPLKLVNVRDGRESNDGSSKRNTAEVEYIRSLVNGLPKGCTRKCNIGILTPYRAQVKLLREKVTDGNVSIRTVDGFQGQECDLVIFSAVRANDFNSLGFLADMNRMNVLLTRAKHGLIIVANKDTFTPRDLSMVAELPEDQFKGAALWQKWMKWAESERIVEDFGEMNSGQAPTRRPQQRRRN